MFVPDLDFELSPAGQVGRHVAWFLLLMPFLFTSAKQRPQRAPEPLTVNLEVLVLPVFNGYHVESGSVGEHQPSGFLHAGGCRGNTVSPHNPPR